MKRLRSISYMTGSGFGSEDSVPKEKTHLKDTAYIKSVNLKQYTEELHLSRQNIESLYNVAKKCGYEKKGTFL